MKNTPVVLFLCLSLLLAGCSSGSSSDSGDSSGDTPGGSDDVTGTAPDGSTGDPYDIGDPTLSEIYVSPTGSDDNSGTSLASPLQTLTAAWALIPASLTTTGYRINLLPGSYPCGDDEMTSCLNYFSDKTGTLAFPIIIQSVSADGTPTNGTATIRGGMNINGVHYLYLIGINMAAGGSLPTNLSGNNVLHVDASDHVLLRSLTLTGPAGRTDTTSTIQEVLKSNQCQDLYLEDSDLSGTFQTVLDYFSVQGGHLLNNRIHGSGGRCAYLKGGSAYFRIEGNEFYDCHEAGFQAGEGSNFDLMQNPWYHYEAYDFKVTNNVIHDIYGAGLSLSGGYNILMAYNTLYRIGLSDDRDWSLLQFVHGSRRCVIVDEYPSASLASARCQSIIDEGGWGTTNTDEGGEWIPNKNVYVYNNIFYNPTGTSTAAIHFAVNGAADLPGDAENIPDPAQTDENIVIRGNIIWNGSGAIELLGTTNGSEPGCDSGNPTCNPTQLAADNSINGFEPQLTDPAAGDFTPVSGGNVPTATTYTIPDFTWDTFTPAVPSGTLANTVTENREGTARSGVDHPGAY